MCGTGKRSGSTIRLWTDIYMLTADQPGGSSKILPNHSWFFAIDRLRPWMNSTRDFASRFISACTPSMCFASATGPRVVLTSYKRTLTPSLSMTSPSNLISSSNSSRVPSVRCISTFASAKYVKSPFEALAGENQTLLLMNGAYHRRALSTAVARRLGSRKSNHPCVL
jgi:hypothetical protein